MRYFFNSNGDYIGGFNAGALSQVPPGSIEVGSPPSHGLDRLVNGVIVPYTPTKTVNEQLESAFLSILPKHLGKPYLTNDLMLQIGTLKQVITDYNKLGLYLISKQMLAVAPLPNEMEVDRQNLLTMYPS